MKKQCFLSYNCVENANTYVIPPEERQNWVPPRPPSKPPLDFAGFGPEGGGLLAIDRLIILVGYHFSG